MFLKTFLAFFAVSCLVGLLFLTTGCSAIAYSDFEPENPYGDLPKSSIPEVVGFAVFFSEHS